MSEFEKKEESQQPAGISQDLSAGALEIEHLQILELIGQGGMSSVYRARQLTLDREVAVKVINGFDEQGPRRFQSEAKISAEFDHPNIIKTLGFGVSKDGRPYLLMALLHGVSLAQEVKINPRMSLRRFREIFLPVLSALEYAHGKGLVHRDIKPSNIMICREQMASGSGETVKLLDFGIAKYSGDGASKQQQLTRTGVVLGSPRYMSPEQCKLEALDSRSDLYSLSCVMYEALFAESPFESDSALEIMHKHMTASPPAATELCKKRALPLKLIELILSGLNKRTEARPASAKEFALSLEKVLENVDLDKNAVRRFQADPKLVLFALSFVALLVLYGCYMQMQVLKEREAMRIKACVEGERLYKDVLKDKKAHTLDEHQAHFCKARTAAKLLSANSRDDNEVAAALYWAAKLGVVYYEERSAPPSRKESNELLEIIDKSIRLRGNKRNIGYLDCLRIKAQILDMSQRPEEAAEVAMQSMPLYLSMTHASETRLARRLYVLPLLAKAGRVAEMESMAKRILDSAATEDPYDETSTLQCKAYLSWAQALAKKNSEAEETAESVVRTLKKNGDIDSYARDSIFEILADTYKELGMTDRFWEARKSDKLAQKQAYARGKGPKFDPTQYLKQ